MIKIGTKNGGEFRQAVRQLKTLTMMQLKEKLDLSFVRSFRKTLFKIVWLIVEFAAITAICTLIFNYVKILGVFSLVGDIPETVMTVIFSLLFFLSVISSTIGLVKSLYFAKDNMVLLTFPVRPYLAFLSKLAVYYVYELKKNIMFTVPIFIAYGISKSYTLAYYPWLLFLFVFISILPVLIAALLSIPFMFVYQFIRKVKVVQYLIYLLLGSSRYVHGNNYQSYSSQYRPCGVLGYDLLQNSRFSKRLLQNLFCNVRFYSAYSRKNRRTYRKRVYKIDATVLRHTYCRGDAYAQLDLFAAVILQNGKQTV